MPDHLLPADSNSSTFVDVWKILCLQIPYVRAAVQNALLSQDKSFSAILRPPYVDLCQVKIGHNWPKIRHFAENPWTKNGKKKGNLIFALLRCVARLDKIYGAVKIHGRSQTEEMGVFCHSRHRLIGMLLQKFSKVLFQICQQHRYWLNWNDREALRSEARAQVEKGAGRRHFSFGLKVSEAT